MFYILGKCNNTCLKFESNYFSFEKPGIGYHLISFGVQSVIFLFALFIFENNLITALYKRLTEKKSNIVIDRDRLESDVHTEELRIKRRSFFTLFQTDSMVLKNVSKHYGKFLAVGNVSFGVKRGECFGILGENGAGKTTLFKMITGSENITSGDIIINGKNVKKDKHLVYKDIGYCPQFNGLVDHLTGRETLKIISNIRGIKQHLIDKQIDSLSKLLRMEKHIDHKVEGYSGGTKRKLSFAIVSAEFNCFFVTLI